VQDFEQLDYYTLLGVEPSASPEAIKRAYRQQIARYHPDRYVNTSVAEQAYAQQRAQRINEAYSVLSDARARLAYNRGQSLPSSSPVPPPQSPAVPPAAPRDHQAELYAQASEHLVSGRTLQAAAVLRQLQQLNPFYRDSAALLAQVEAQLRAEDEQRKAPAGATPAAEGSRQRRKIVAGVVGGAAALGLAAAAFAWRGQRNEAATPVAGAPTAIATSAATTAPTVEAAPAPTIAEPTSEPTAEPLPTAAPTEPPTQAPSPAPTEPPTLLPSPVLEEGALRVDEDFENGAGWARAQAQGWSVGYADSFARPGTVYQIVADPGVGNIWSYRTAPSDRSDYSVGVDVDVQGQGGSAGILVRFQDRANYVVCLINPSANTYRVEQRRFGRVLVVAEGTAALQPNTTARVVARVEGATLTLVINGALVAEAQLADLPTTPLYGLVAAAESEQVVAQFDNLELRDVEPGA
jgi:curved DNA-binding protein CbpA